MNFSHTNRIRFCTTNVLTNPMGIKPLPQNYLLLTGDQYPHPTHHPKRHLDRFYATNSPLVAENCPYRTTISTPIHAAHIWIYRTHYPRQHRNPLSRFSTTHTDRQTNRPTDTKKVWKTAYALARRRGLIIIILMTIIARNQNEIWEKAASSSPECFMHRRCPIPAKTAPYSGGTRRPSVWFLGPNRPITPNGISIESAVFAQYTLVTMDRRPGGRTERRRNSAAYAIRLRRGQ